MRKYPLWLIHLALTALSLTLLGKSTAAEPIQATTPRSTLVTAQASPNNPRQAQLLHAFKNPSIPPLNATSVTLSYDNQLMASVGDFIRTWDLKSCLPLPKTAAK